LVSAPRPSPPIFWCYICCSWPFFCASLWLANLYSNSGKFIFLLV
jgi:hypothetical protein